MRPAWYEPESDHLPPCEVCYRDRETCDHLDCARCHERICKCDIEDGRPRGWETVPRLDRNKAPVPSAKCADQDVPGVQVESHRRILKGHGASVERLRP